MLTREQINWTYYRKLVIGELYTLPKTFRCSEGSGYPIKTYTTPHNLIFHLTHMIDGHLIGNIHGGTEPLSVIMPLGDLRLRLPIQVVLIQLFVHPFFHLINWIRK